MVTPSQTLTLLGPSITAAKGLLGLKKVVVVLMVLCVVVAVVRPVVVSGVVTVGVLLVVV